MKQTGNNPLDEEGDAEDVEGHQRRTRIAVGMSAQGPRVDR